MGPRFIVASAEIWDDPKHLSTQTLKHIFLRSTASRQQDFVNIWAGQFGGSQNFADWYCLWMINLILVLLWANKIIVENPFPNVLRRSRVVNVRERILNPLEVTIFYNTFISSSFNFQVACEALLLKSSQVHRILAVAGIYGSDKSVSKDSSTPNSPSSRPKLQQRLDLKQLELLLQGSISPSVFFSLHYHLLRDILTWNFFRWMPGCLHTPKRSHNRNKEIDTVSTASTDSLQHLGLFQNTYM